MTGLLVLFGGMALFATIIVVMDLIAERREQREKDHSKGRARALTTDN
jgi:hypothetical protein